MADKAIPPVIDGDVLEPEPPPPPGTILVQKYCGAAAVELTSMFPTGLSLRAMILDDHQKTQFGVPLLWQVWLISIFEFLHE